MDLRAVLPRQGSSRRVRRTVSRCWMEVSRAEARDGKSAMRPARKHVAVVMVVIVVVVIVVIVVVVDDIFSSSYLLSRVVTVVVTELCAQSKSISCAISSCLAGEVDIRTAECYLDRCAVFKL